MSCVLGINSPPSNYNVSCFIIKIRTVYVLVYRLTALHYSENFFHSAPIRSFSFFIQQLDRLFISEAGILAAL